MSEFRPGDLCRTLDHPDIKPEYRNVEVLIVAGPLSPPRARSVDVYLFECPALPEGWLGKCQGRYLVKRRPPDTPLSSWAECPWQPVELERASR